MRLIFKQILLFLSIISPVYVGCNQAVTYERVASITDLSQERDLFIAAFMSAYKDEHAHFESIGIFDMHCYFSDVFDEEFSHVKQQLQAEFPIYFIRARVDEHTVGFITFHSTINEDGQPHQIYIRWLAVSPAFGRLGIGKGLVACIKKMLPDVERLILVAYKLDKPAMNFWGNSMGFSLSDYSRPEYDSVMFQGYTYNID
jgi:ribosomal protein S18 acetylase RimI-like enzyme